MEITGGRKSLFEGGLQYNNDQSIQPYARYYNEPESQGSYINIPAQTYTCDQNLAIMTGILSDGSYVYTQTGIVPSNLDPSTNWVNYGVFTLNSSSYTFWENTIADFGGSGIDNAGVPTPCAACSVSQVTALAQNLPQGTLYSLDGSFFGISQATGAQIQWMQVAFGEWQSGCYQGAAVCTFQFSPTFSLYEGGAQNIPDNNVALGFPNALGWGAYNTYDGVDLSNGDIYEASEQRAGGAFTEPAPPIQCTADSQGYCYTTTGLQVQSSINCNVPTVHGTVSKAFPTKSQQYYFVYGNQGTLLEKVGVTNQYTSTCTPTLISATWSPAEPRSQYNDINLP